MRGRALLAGLELDAMNVRDRLALTYAVAVDHGARAEEVAEWLETPLWPEPATEVDLEAWASDEAWLEQQERMMAELA